jgi:hypothetical protein
MRILSLLFFLPLGALASGHGRSARSKHQHRAHHIQQNQRRAPTYQLADMYKGQNFFNDWTFFTAPDPTHGNVNFLDATTAASAQLAYVDANGTAIMAADDTQHLAPGANRNSVRIGSNKAYDGGLFIADLAAMPYGCGVWPSWWTVGPGWPNGGEIDVLEGVNLGTTNQYTLHTSSGCTLEPPPAQGQGDNQFTAHLLGTQCASGAATTGCAMLDSDPRSYGEGFNNAGGGVFAHTWDESGIKIWHFPRAEIPADITSGNPDPSTWPTASAFFSSQTCDMASHFYQHQLIFDITLCGDWAGAVYGSSGCPGTCGDAVADPENFTNAKFKINYVAVYT